MTTNAEGGVVFTKPQRTPTLRTNYLCLWSRKKTIEFYLIKTNMLLVLCLDEKKFFEKLQIVMGK